MRDVLALAGWSGDDIPRALSVALCESRYGPTSNNGTHWGLFELADFWFPTFGVPFERWSDPVTNATMARWIYERDGWSPWAQCL